MRDLLTEHWETIERFIAVQVRRFRMLPEFRDDFAQDCRMMLVERGERLLAAYRGHCSLETYLFAVVRTYARSWLRRRRTDQYRYVLDARALDEPAITASVQSVSSEPDARVRALRFAIARLRPAEREIVIRRYAHGWSVSRLARVKGLTPAVVSRRLYRVRQRLATLMLNARRAASEP